MNLAFINALKERLKRPLPGQEVQFEMAHVNRQKLGPLDLDPAEFRNSAVMILLCPKNDHFFIPLTERHIYKGAHSGQVSFPGGKFDEGDITLENTARRECAEEIGISEQVEIIGALTPLYIPVSKFMVHPFLAFIKNDHVAFNINESEVRAIVELDVAELSKPHLIKETIVEGAPGIKFKTPYFDVQGKVVWGATAMILNELKSLLADL